MKKLETLVLSKSKVSQTLQITDAGVDAISKGCSKLKTLELAWCKGVTQKSIVSVERLTQLSSLDLELCGQINNASCKILGRMFLSSLNLSGNNSITNGGILYLTKPSIHLPNSNENGNENSVYYANLKMPGSPQKAVRVPEISPKSSAALAKKCQLENVELRHLTSISMTGLELFVMNAKKLKKIDVGHCREINLHDEGRGFECRMALLRRGCVVNEVLSHIIRAPL